LTSGQTDAETIVWSEPPAEPTPVTEFAGFRPALIEFLEKLAGNNNRPWFQANKAGYERDVLGPSLAFIRAFQSRLKRISPYFVASDRRVGGSLMRVYRDTRFFKHGEPYKTNVGIQFRHEFGRDIHAPGFYVHIAPDECFLALGIWRPDRAALVQIRRAIEESPGRWRRARNNKRFRESFVLGGSSLKSAPRGFAADHPLIEDLKRTDFLGLCDLSEQDVLDEGFLDSVATAFAAGCPFMRFLCDALRVPF
jgi:uncharacterized protein (TIGR02453 family)